mgnify:CR=1 FL=1
MWGTLQQDAIEFGNIIHQILSYITTKNDLQSALTKSLDEGLIQQSQKSIFEDKKGQIWFGTWSGISLYDGYSFSNATDLALS